LCGPSSINLPNALANAYLDSVPFLVVTGNIPTTQFGRGAFHELYRHYQADYPSTVRSMCKHVFQPRAIPGAGKRLERRTRETYLRTCSPLRQWSIIAQRATGWERRGKMFANGRTAGQCQERTYSRQSCYWAAAVPGEAGKRRARVQYAMVVTPGDGAGPAPPLGLGFCGACAVGRINPDDFARN
jgi:hypothetical protein